MVQATNGKLYGVTFSGGANSVGVLFEYDPSANSYQVKHSFGSQINSLDGCCPVNSLIQATNGKLYGAAEGGLGGQGIVYEYDLTTSTFAKVDFYSSFDGVEALSTVMQASNGKIYGMTQQGGTYAQGTLYEYDPVTGALAKKFDFDGINGGIPHYTHLIEVAPGTGTEELAGNDLSVHPNPSAGVFTLETFVTGDEQRSIEITNTLGEQVAVIEAGDISNGMYKKHINIAHLPAGVYFITLETGGVKTVKKVIKR